MLLLLLTFAHKIEKRERALSIPRAGGQAGKHSKRASSGRRPASRHCSTGRHYTLRWRCIVRAAAGRRLCCQWSPAEAAVAAALQMEPPPAATSKQRAPAERDDSRAGGAHEQPAERRRRRRRRQCKHTRARLAFVQETENCCLCACVNWLSICKINFLTAD